MAKKKKKTKAKAKGNGREEKALEVKALRMLFRKFFLASLMLVVSFILLGFVWASITSATATLTASFIVLFLVVAGFYALYLGEVFSTREAKALKRKHKSYGTMLYKGFIE